METTKKFKSQSYSGTSEYFFFAENLNSWIYAKHEEINGVTVIIASEKISAAAANNNNFEESETIKSVENNQLFSDQKLFDRSKTFQNLVAKYKSDQYSLPLSAFLDEGFLIKKLKDRYGFEYEIKRMQEELEKERKFTMTLTSRITTLQIYGTENQRTIEKIKKENAKTEAKKDKEAKKQKAILIKQKTVLIKENIKKGNMFIAINRNWSGSRKHLKFQGETASFENQKPRTRTWFEIKNTKEGIIEIANILLSY